MEKISTPIIILFLLTVLATVLLFFKATHYSRTVIIIMAIWIILQTSLGIAGFYTSWSSVPPRFPLMIVPPVLCIVVLLILPRGRRFLDAVDLRTLTILHIIRVPVEITLFYLLVAKLIPESMTFEGSNFDILSGITAPIVYFLVFMTKKLGYRFLLAWNFICLALLLNVVITAILSAKTPFQQLAFDQPNIAVTYFPFTLLAAVVVPIVMVSHVAAIRQLVRKKNAVDTFKIAAAT